MIQEKDKTYLIEPLFAHFSEKYILKPYGYHHLLNVLANDHLKQTDQGIGVILTEKYAWVLVSMTIEIVEPIVDLKQLLGKTWYAGRRGPFYRREYLIENQAGKVVSKGASYSILMDMSSRSIFRGKELPFKSLKEVNEQLINAEPRLKSDYAFVEISERQVLNSHLDPLGHVNNLRYHEYIYDALSEEEIEKIDKIKRIELYFQKELQKDDQFSISKFTENNISYYQIHNETTNMKAFTIVLYFNKD